MGLLRTRSIPHLAAMALLAAMSTLVYAQQKDTAAGEHLFSSNCAACHGSDGRGGERAPNIATRRSVISLSDIDLEGIVTKGLSGVGMPAFGYLGSEKISDVVAYLRVLQGRGTAVKVTGDVKAGHELFYGKAGCSKCHMMQGEGGFIASDLTTYGDNLSAVAVRRAIVTPDQNLDSTSKIVEVYDRNGQHISGFVRAEDNFSLTVQTEDGRYHFFSKAKLATVLHTSHSSMPRNYESILNNKEIEDLVSYLITTASVPHPTEPSKKRGKGDGN
jgi:cytochrome c oxidase cbb3-type subunit III